MAKRVIVAAGQAKPVAPYSPGIMVGNTLYLAGQIGLLPDGKTLPAGIREQTIICMNKVKELCAAADLTLDNVVDCTVLLADMSYYAEMNEEYAKFWTNGVPPARAAFAVKGLPLGALVEIKCIAVKF